MVVSPMAIVPVLVNVTTPPVKDVLPTTVFGNEKLSGVIVIWGNADGTPRPDTASEMADAFVVVMAI